MYSSGYSHVSKYSPEAQRKMRSRSKGKSCGYYMRIVFFFSSLIQSLIIVSLVLFLIYGKTQDSPSTARIQDLEESFSRLSMENVALRQQRKNLTTLLNTTLTEKARNDWDLNRLRYVANISMIIIHETDRKLQQCKGDLIMCKPSPFSPVFPPPKPLPDGCQCGPLFERTKARLTLVEVNFTRTVQDMTMEAEKVAKDRDRLNLEAIQLRRDKSRLERQVEELKEKCKKDFIQSLSGVQEVTKAFLEKIESLYHPQHNTFQLTCPNQINHLEQIRTNCTSLSREVEDKFQRYLNNVGEQMSVIQSENSRLKAENWRLNEDYRWCSQNRTGLILQNKQNLDKLQRKHDDEKEGLLMDKMKLNGQMEVLENSVRYKTKEAEHLAEQLKHLNMTCVSKFPGVSPPRIGSSQPGVWGSYGGGGSSSSGVGQIGRTGFGSSGSTLTKQASTGTGSSSSSLFSSGSSSSLGSAFNKPVSTGTGSSSSSLFSSGSSSSLGSTFNKPSSTGTGSSSSSIFSSGSSSSLGSTFNKPSSTGTGSSSSSLLSSGSSSSLGSTFNKPSSTGTGSSSSSLFSSGSSSSIGSGLKSGSASSSFGTAGSSPNLSSSGRGSSSIGQSSGSTGSSSSLSGTGFNKPASTVKSSPGLGSSSGSTGSTSKSGSSSSGFSWLGFGSSNSGQSKTGSGTGKGTSSGTGYSGTGSSYGGRTNGLAGVSSIDVARHLQELHHLINPGNRQENQDLTRVVG